MEGGMLVTNNEAYYELGKSLRAHGWSRELKNKKQIEKKYPNINSNFLFSNLGYNLKITDMQAACGLAQLERIDEFVQKRRHNFSYLTKKFT